MTEKTTKHVISGPLFRLALWFILGFVVGLMGCSFLLLPDSGGEPVLELGPNSLVVRIDDSSGARTAYPTAGTIASYTVTVIQKDSEAVLGSLSFSASETGSHPVALNAVPSVGDRVYVEGFTTGNLKIAGGGTALAEAHIAPNFNPVTVTVRPSSSGSGSVSLSISLPTPTSWTAPDTEITAVEITLYRGLGDYQSKTAYQFKRYRKNSDYGEGTDFDAGPSLTLEIDSLPSGDYVAKAEFFRGKFIKVKTLIQTLLVRDGLVTDKWDGGSNALNLSSEGQFTSSNANLTGISIGGTTISGFNPAAYSYSITKAGINAETPTLTITPGVPGQTIEAKLNGTAASNGSALTLKLGANSLSITVTAPDGVTKQTYAVSYAYRHGTVWHVAASDQSPAGNDTTGNGTEELPFATVGKALDAIKAAYNSSWPGWDAVVANRVPVPALIQISGTINTETTTGYFDADSLIKITDTALYNALPPIILEGDGTGSDDEIDAGGSGRVLYIENAEVILGDNLTITGGETSGGGSGSGVYVDSGSFTMNGGTISGNDAAGNGGGVYVDSGSFTMNGGSVDENEAAGSGSGVYVDSGSFTMNGGSVGGNTISGGVGGRGVYVLNGSFTMNGGSVSGNTGIGVSVLTDYSFTGSFTMNGGSVSGNTGEGVHISGTGSGSTFTMNGGEISGNSGGVYVQGSGSTFIMNGGSVSGNTGGGIYVYMSIFTMNGGSVSGNTGGGMHIRASTFTMNGGSFSGNTVSTGDGGGVYLSGGGCSFTMNGGSISGNTASGSGGGVYVSYGSFTVSGGSVGGNTATNNGGGVYVTSGTSFTMSEGSVSGNTASGLGGGVYNVGSFTMSGSAVVNADNKVYLNSPGVITLSGPLSANPAANIEDTGFTPGTPLLGNDADPTVADDIGAGTPPNYTRFLVEGEAGKINSSGEYTGG